MPIITSSPWLRVLLDLEERVLRDIFAGLALIELSTSGSPSPTATLAYNMADAMMAAGKGLRELVTGVRP